MNDRARRRERLRMIVKAESRELCDAELFPQNARRVIKLKGPIFQAGLDAAGALEKRSLGRFEELLWTGEQRFAWPQKLQFLAECFVGARARKFGDLKFAGREINESQ